MHKKESKLLIVSFLLPGLILYSTFVIYPILSSFYTSLFNWSGIGEMDWVGFKNFINIFSDGNFINSLLNTGKYMLYQIPMILVLAILFGMIVATSKETKFINSFRTLVFLPYVLPSVAIAMLWVTVFNPISGFLNLSLDAIGLGFLTKDWLAHSGTAFGSIVWVKTWGSVGFYTVLILSGILNIPKEVLEAAEIDGANRIQRSVYVILPMLKNVLQVVIVFVLINSLRIFEEPQLMTSGGPNRSTEPISLYIYEQAFANHNFGYASAMGVVFVLITLILTLLTLRVTRMDAND